MPYYAFDRGTEVKGNVERRCKQCRCIDGHVKENKEGILP